MKVACLGSEGTFGWRVATRDNPEAVIVFCGSHLQVIQAVINGKARKGYVARENSLGGTVVDTVDPLIKNPIGIMVCWEDGKVVSSRGDFMVCGETVLPIVQCLYGHRGMHKVTRMYSHPQALTQCEEFIERRFPGVQLVPANSTVGGVEKLREDTEAVAIAPPWAADFYPDISLLESGIQGSSTNDTRFLVIGKEDCAPTGTDKTSIWFTVPGENKPGSLVRVLNVLAASDINMGLVESRPAKTTLGRYVFLVDVDGHRLDPHLTRALDFIVSQGFATGVCILGSYPRWKNGI